MPPAVRKYDVPVKGSRLYRYPSVGSEPTLHDETAIDYKTAYRDSLHHIRHNVDTHKVMDERIYIAEPFGGTLEEKLYFPLFITKSFRLKSYGYLSQDQFGDAEAVQRAREQYEKDTGESVDVNGK